jgi:hypothetical protein
MSVKFNPLIFTGLDFSGGGGGGYTGFKDPVATEAALPLVGNTDGDVRVTQDSDKIWVWSATASRWIDASLSVSSAIGATPNSIGYSLALTNSGLNRQERQLTLQPADSTNPGVVSTLAQNFAGTKTFDNDVNVDGALFANTDLTVGGTTTLDTALEGPLKASLGVVSSSAIDLASPEVTGTLPIANGGTNSSTALNNNRFVVSSGGALVEHSAVTANRALASDASGLPAASATTSTELGYLSGVTSAVQTQLNSKIPSTEKGAANGVATLDAGGKVPVAQLPSAVMTYEGVWNASTNTPTLADGVGDVGMVYRVSVAGTQNLGSGAIAFDVGDYVILNSSLVWEKSDTTDAVASVNGQVGIVSLNTDNIPEGTAVYFTDERAQDAVGAMLANTTTINLSYVDGTPSLSASLNALSVDDTHISATAAIARTKLASGTANHVLINDASGVMSSEATLSISRGGTGLATTPTNGKLLIGNGTGYTLASLTGTANQVTVTDGAGSITLSLPQDIATASSPTFAGLTLTAFSGAVYASAGVLASEAQLSITRGGTGLGSTPTNGQLLIGNGTGYSLATITAGTGISVTNGAGSITIASSTGSTGDINETSFSANDNEATPVNVTGLAFANATVRSFEALVSIVRASTYAQYKLFGIQKGASWELDQSFVGDITGLEFSITSAGQVQYTSTNTGSGATLKFRAFVTTV